MSEHKHQCSGVLSNVFTEPDEGLLGGIILQHTVIDTENGAAVARTHSAFTPNHVSFTIVVNYGEGEVVKHLVMDWERFIELVEGLGTPDELIEAEVALDKVHGVDDLMNLMNKNTEQEKNNE